MSNASPGVAIDLVPTTEVTPPTWDEIWRLTRDTFSYKSYLLLPQVVVARASHSPARAAAHLASSQRAEIYSHAPSA